MSEDEKLVEELARAICESCGDDPEREGPWEEWCHESAYADQARAILPIINARVAVVERERDKAREAAFCMGFRACVGRPLATMNDDSLAEHQAWVEYLKDDDGA